MKIVKIEPFAHLNLQMARLGKQEWSVARLITLTKDFEVMIIPLIHLNIYHRYENVNLRELVGHMKSVLNADLKYPIILDEDGELMDGRHRLMKALLENRKVIKAVRFTENPSACKTNE